MNKSVLVKEFKKVFKKLSKTTLMEIAESQDLLHNYSGDYYYTHEELSSLILDQVISNFSSTFEATTLMEHHDIDIIKVLDKTHVYCKYCGDKTLQIGTQLCHGCWEIESRLNSLNGIDIVKKIIEQIDKG